jgi:hypothetical protein
MAKDMYLTRFNATARLIEEWLKYGKIVIAYDYDHTVFDYLQAGHTYDKVIALLKRCNEFGADFIVFTCKGENKYDEIKDYLTTNNVPFNKINENMDHLNFDGRKVYYNILLDDRAGLDSAYKTLLNAVKFMEKKGRRRK